MIASNPAAEPIVHVVDLVPGTVCAIPEVTSEQLGTDGFWRDYVLKHRLVVIRAGASHWPAIERWKDGDYLVSHTDEVEVKYGRTFNFSPALGFAKRAFRKPLPDLLSEMLAAPVGSVYGSPALPLPKSWLPELGNFHFLPSQYDKLPRSYERRRVFVYRNAGTEWHFHPLDETLTVQLRGSKRCSLFRLDDKTFNPYALYIESNVHHLDCAKRIFPADASVTKHEAILHPGDALYIPPFYWHGIDPSDDDVGVTLAHCFRSPISRVGSWSDPLTKRTVRRQLLSGKIGQSLELAGLTTAGAVARWWKKEKW